MHSNPTLARCNDSCSQRGRAIHTAAFPYVRNATQSAKRKRKILFLCRVHVHSQRNAKRKDAVFTDTPIRNDPQRQKIAPWCGKFEFCALRCGHKRKRSLLFITIWIFFLRIALRVVLRTNGNAAFLCSLLSEYQPSSSLRSISEKLLVIPKINTKSQGQRSFSYQAPTIWNALPHPSVTLLLCPRSNPVSKVIFQKAFSLQP